MPKAEVNGQGNHGCHGNSSLKFWLFSIMNFIFEIMKIGKSTLLLYSVLPRNFITWDNVPGHLKMWGHLRKKRGHCVKNDGTVILR